MRIAGLRTCSASSDTAFRINRHQPVVVLVHGRLDSPSRFYSLAEAFASRGQQAICFTYRYRDTMDYNASRLTQALLELDKHLARHEITVMGHSLGGLIARRALTRERSYGFWEDRRIRFRLITVSTPFAGISWARDCGSKSWKTLTLGISNIICRAIIGSSWREITEQSRFIRQPGELLPQVVEHLKVVTDERNSCRSYDRNHLCTQSDFVFSLKEQYTSAVDDSARVENVQVRAGHTEIVGDYQTVPRKLITILQQYAVMKKEDPKHRLPFQYIYSSQHQKPLLP